MSASKLIKPSAEYKDSYLEALEEFHAEGRYMFLDKTELDNDFEGFVSDLRDGKSHTHKPFADWAEPVDETALWMVKEEQFIGALTIRHRLNWHLEKWGGHMNFVIRPTMRGKGFGKKMLKNGMACASFLGVDRALITIDPENKSAVRAVEFCGGEFQDETPATEQFPARLRYWLNCA